MHFYIMKAVPHIVIGGTKSVGTSLLRVASHLCFITPYMQSSFFFGLGSLSTLSFEGGMQMCREMFPTALKYAFVFWPFAVSILYFGFVPMIYGNLLMDSLGLFWAVILSAIANPKPPLIPVLN